MSIGPSTPVSVMRLSDLYRVLSSSDYHAVIQYFAACNVAIEFDIDLPNASPYASPNVPPTQTGGNAG